MKPRDKILTNVFIQMIVKSLDCVFTWHFLENFFQCPEIFTNSGKIKSKIGHNLNLAPKMKNRFLARQALYIAF